MPKIYLGSVHLECIAFPSYHVEVHLHSRQVHIAVRGQVSWVVLFSGRRAPRTVPRGEDTFLILFVFACLEIYAPVIRKIAGIGTRNLGMRNCV
jgi:hypothetical protein